MVKEIDARINEIDKEIEDIKSKEVVDEAQIYVLKRERHDLVKMCKNLDPHDKVYLARHKKRPKITEYIDAIFDDFFEQKGDALGKEDGSIFGGIATFDGMPVTVIGHRKGNDLAENLTCNFGMPGPEGYRKALRLMKQAEKFGRPIITFIDTPGAYPGIEAETNGQSQAIATNLAKMSALKVPVIAIVTGEGSSGGALAIGVANSVLMLENAVYSILSPEGYATILWKDSTRSDEACSMMKLTAQDLKDFHVIDEIIPEPIGGAHLNPKLVYKVVEKYIRRELAKYSKMGPDELAKHRYKKFRTIDSDYLNLL
ncbi:MAG: acetyl-CoA carboxylase carboxyltransferase subunit alpha [Lachnospiraceae bacterium]|nr:acetyl-CoA carboxylase carboxyltransferase subunit alpha [Lachnospiraceae bacterium]